MNIRLWLQAFVLTPHFTKVDQIQSRWWPRFKQSNTPTVTKSDLFWSVWPQGHQVLNQCLYRIGLGHCCCIMYDFSCLLQMCYLQLNIYRHQSNCSKRKASGMTYWINTQLSILSMQIEIEVLHLSLDFRKAQWKTWYMHPFPLAIYFLWKDDSYITVSQNFEANTWQPSSIFFTEQRKSGILQTSQNSLYFPCCLCALCCYPQKA